MSTPTSGKPRFSKTAVNRAGEVLVADPTNEEALEVLDYWRSLHAEPLEELFDVIFVTTDFKTAVHYIMLFSGSFRLKRTVSIIEKLKRNPSMNLVRMQDIAGFRCVLQSSQLELESPDWFRKFIAEEQGRIAQTYPIKKLDDYVAEPKLSGYRAVHLILGIPDDLQIEIQFRTRLQHLWAMAVETVGMFYGEALKASQGDQGWLEFFKLASAAFSHLEKSPVIAEHAEKSFEQICDELRREGTEKTFFKKLATIKEVDEKYSTEEYDYWLLELNIKKGTNAIYGFKSNQLETAQEMYAAKEQTPACLRGDVQVVLVSTRSFKDLREAYPSYFLYVAEFTTTIRNICNIPV